MEIGDRVMGSGAPESVLCWWCNEIADSREHKFKRKDLTRAYGPGQWGNTNPVAHMADGSQSNVMSSRSNRLKFDAVLCKKCNNETSQPFDNAYDTFSDYYSKNKQTMLAANGFEWDQVFDARNWRLGRDQVTRYWVKHIATRLAHDNVPVPTALAAYMNDTKSLTHLELHLGIRDDWVAVEEHQRETHNRDFGQALWLGPADAELDPTAAHVETVWSHLGIDWLRLSWTFHRTEIAGTTNFDQRVVRLPHDWSVDPNDLRTTCEDCNFSDADNGPSATHHGPDVT